MDAMKKLEIKMKWCEIGDKALEALQLVGYGLVALLALVTIVSIVAIANVFIQLGEWLKEAIENRPVPSVAVTFGIMLVAGVFACILVYVQFKYKITTAEWQRDSLELSLDSLREACGMKATYTRTIPMRREEALP